jgi:hypothetical protein
MNECQHLFPERGVGCAACDGYYSWRDTADVLETHWLTNVGCQHYVDGTGDNAAACWCGWIGPRVANVGLAVESWAKHAASAIEAATATGTASTLPEGHRPKGRRMIPPLKTQEP